jgi:hypothetical protein
MNNPPAFPTSHEEPDDYNGHNNSKKIVIDQGMTLRDYFAAKAMQSLLTNETLYLSTVSIAEKAGMSIEAALTQMAYQVADAMLKARET